VKAEGQRHYGLVWILSGRSWIRGWQMETQDILTKFGVAEASFLGDEQQLLVFQDRSRWPRRR